MTMQGDWDALVRAYLDAIGAGAIGDTLAAYFHPYVEQVEFPNRLASQGASRDLAAILAAAERGQAVVRRQSFDVTSILVQADRAAVEAIWEAELDVPVGLLARGDTMRAHFAMFFEFRDGRIWRQRNYDCFDAF
jgi:ketosteroid isomerase-like protein